MSIHLHKYLLSIMQITKARQRKNMICLTNCSNDTATINKTVNPKVLLFNSLICIVGDPDYRTNFKPLNLEHTSE